MTSEPGGRPGLPVEVRRSARRRRTVSAYRRDGRLVVLIPAWFTEADERHWVERMSARLSAPTRRVPRSDAELASRARRLSGQFLGGRAHPTSVRWVANQGRRWGSATPSDGSIRLSTRLQPMPTWVVDYVLLHELAHLVEAGHGAGFWALLDGFPHRDRARGYLDGYSAGSGRPWADDDVDAGAVAADRSPGQRDGQQRD